MGIPSPDGGAKQQGGGGGGAGGRPPERVIPFGKYQLLERVSVGGMAEVFKAKSFGIEGFEKILAVKRILPTMAEDGDFIEMFIDEAKIAGQLSHANICPIYELGKVGDSHYIAMEFVWGKDLLQLMNRFRKMRKHMPPAMVAWIGAKVCEGLDYAHRKRDRNGNPMNIIHRDMSPQNVLVSYEGQVKIIDFGIAKAASRTTKTQAGVLKGKFGYMSPEQVRGLPVDARSDLFAIGTCMHEMSTGERLFLGESDFTTLEKVRNAEVPPPSRGLQDYPPELERIVMKALTLDVGDRWSSAAEMQEALQRFLASQKPPYGTSKLAAWMKTAFAAELAAEKERMQAYQTAARTAPPSAPPAAPAGLPRPRMPAMLGLGGAPALDAPTLRPPLRKAAAAPAAVAPMETSQLDTADLAAADEDMDELAGEKTMVGSSLFDDDAGPTTDLPEQPTQIFFSADELVEAEAPAAPRPSSGSGAAGVEVAHGELFGAAPAAAQRVFPAPQARASLRPAPQAAPAFQPPAPAAQSSPTFQPPAPAFQPPQAPLFVGSEPHGAAPGLPFNPQQPLTGYAPPAGPVTPHGFASPPSAAKPAPQSGGRGQLVAIALAAVVLIAAGAGIAVLLFGRPAGGTVEVQTIPAVPGDIYVDGTLLGQAPKRLEPVPPGEHVIEVRAAGYTPALRRVTVTAGNTMMMEIAMIASAPAAAPPSALALGAGPSPAPLGVVSPLPGLPMPAAPLPPDPMAQLPGALLPGAPLPGALLPGAPPAGAASPAVAAIVPPAPAPAPTPMPLALPPVPTPAPTAPRPRPPHRRPSLPRRAPLRRFPRNQPPPRSGRPRRRRPPREHRRPCLRAPSHSGPPPSGRPRRALRRPARPPRRRPSRAARVAAWARSRSAPSPGRASSWTGATPGATPPSATSARAPDTTRSGSASPMDRWSTSRSTSSPTRRRPSSAGSDRPPSSPSALNRHSAPARSDRRSVRQVRQRGRPRAARPVSASCAGRGAARAV